MTRWGVCLYDNHERTTVLSFINDYVYSGYTFYFVPIHYSRVKLRKS